MTPRILVVDDEPDLQRLIERKFRQEIRENQLEFVFASNGKEALRLVQEDMAIEIILSDLNMPEMDGLTLMRHLKELARPLKTIVVSAYGDLKNIRMAMNYGAFDFLTKPIDFDDVATTIARTAGELQQIKNALLTRQKLTIMECELDLASRIQNALLPSTASDTGPGSPVEIFAQMIPARVVGGDFYDFFEIAGGRLGFVIGDVSGKGVPASLFMTATRILMRSVGSQGGSPGHCLAQVNESLLRERVPAMFVTVFYGILDIASGEIEFSIAGHNMPYRFSEEGVRLINGDTGPVLGILERAEFPTVKTVLQPGEGLLLYTDGVTEALNAAEEEFSPERLAETVSRRTHLPARHLVGEIVQSVQQHSAGMGQTDDLTALIIRYLGQPVETRAVPFSEVSEAVPSQLFGRARV
jgi:phosphoserine phosphatase RsbU/P